MMVVQKTVVVKRNGGEILIEMIVLVVMRR